ncbi:hypothetical protein WHR41_08643 [Cladosporium halotolerans]|uniref:Auxiliary Activity family 9 catalytic domain-containing protein n=1 Tax=Cladosporium halotolerans TaxID=1052096 RepID=A0AB34KDX6_9PEZI
MMYQASLAAAVAALAMAPGVAAHGHVKSITVNGGQTYPGAVPNWYYLPANQVPATAGWYALNQDNGFVEPSKFGTSDIACHKSAKPGSTSIPVKAGDTLKLQWDTWPESHHGPVIDYLAKVNSFSSATASSLSFFKIAESGLINGASPPGTWASDNLIKNGNAWNVKIPSSLPSGSYVLRHEIIGLHSAGSNNGAQNYPQCINLQVTGGSGSVPSGTPATSLYKANDPGILISIYQSLSSYKIPGPALSGIRKMARHARDFAVEE